MHFRLLRVKKPAAVNAPFFFGYAWFKGCEGVFSIESLKDCEHALELVRRSKPINVEWVKLFLQAMEKNSISLPLLPVRSSPDDELVDEAYVEELIKLFQDAC